MELSTWSNCNNITVTNKSDCTRKSHRVNRLKTPTYFASPLTIVAAQCEHPQEEGVGFVLHRVLEPACSAHALVELLSGGWASVVQHRLYSDYHTCKKQDSLLFTSRVNTDPPPPDSSCTSWEEAVHTHSEWRILSVTFAMEVEGRAPPSTHFSSGWISLRVNAAWSVVDGNSNWLDGNYLPFSETRCKEGIFSMSVSVSALLRCVKCWIC